MCLLVLITAACVSFQESKFDGILFLVQKARSERLTYALVVEESTEIRTCTVLAASMPAKLPVIVKMEKVIQ